MTPPVHHIVLVGLPGSGKSTTGHILATRMQRPHHDVDSIVEGRVEQTVAEIVAERGIDWFREQEREVAEELLHRDDASVISAGGGLIAQPGAAELMRRHGTVIWLDAEDEELLRRLGDEVASRPLLRDDPPARLRELRSSREAAHGRAHLRIDTGGLTPEDVAARVDALLAEAVRVPLDDSYHLVFADSRVALDETLQHHLPAAARTVVLIADASLDVAAQRLVSALRGAQRRPLHLRVDGGEEAKSWARAGEVLEAMAGAGVERSDCVVALGGGTLGDLAGFCAATYHRGIEWINIPTTLLAMVDSSIGGKTAVNLSGGKNLAGAFWQPRTVICDIDFVDTLEERAYRQAFAEIVKTAMIGGDEVIALLGDGEVAALKERDHDLLRATVRATCNFKATVVAADEREQGLRAVLNYGHTAGHALETASGGAVTHGEAVATGLRVAGALSIEVLDCPRADIEWQDDRLRALGLEGVAFEAGAVLERMRADKKARAGSPRWVLLEERGRPRVGVGVDPVTVRRALQECAGR